MGLLYLFQERELLARSPRRFYYLIPSLERSDTIGGRSVIGGFGFLTLAIVTGFLWNRSLHGRYWTGDPKEWAALVAWLIYVAILVARWRWGWGGRRAAWLAIAGFLVVVFTFGWATLAPQLEAKRDSLTRSEGGAWGVRRSTPQTRTVAVAAR
jgi:ABC-type transport system involved in cytochrome c biogenesis permease subunit